MTLATTAPATTTIAGVEVPTTLSINGHWRDGADRMRFDVIDPRTARVYTKEMTRAFEVSLRLEAGMVGMNRGLVSEAGAPFGSLKASDPGREGGHLGIDEYLEARYLALGRVTR